MQDCTTYHSIKLIKSTITILKPISVLIITWWLVSHTLHIVSCVRAHTRLVLGPCLRAQASAHTRTLHTRTITASGAVFRGHQQTTIEWSWSETRKYFLKIPTDLRPDAGPWPLIVAPVCQHSAHIFTHWKCVGIRNCYSVSQSVSNSL